jgi:hypothetical protein
MLSPNPVDPHEFEVLISDNSKALKIEFILSATIPVPEPLTANSILTFSPSSFI